MWSGTTGPIRIQITQYSQLVAEVVVTNFTEADKLWAAYAVVKYRHNRPIGGCVMQRADLPRMWDVPVGSFIQH
jgi:hypothetical protein